MVTGEPGLLMELAAAPVEEEPNHELVFVTIQHRPMGEQLVLDLDQSRKPATRKSALIQQVGINKCL